MSEGNKKDQYKKYVETSFLILGVGSLLSWNTILTELDFFMHYQLEYQPQNVFGNINFAINLTLQLYLLASKKTVSYKKRIIFGLSCYIFSLIILPIATIYSNMIGQKYMGFICCCVAVFINGFGNAVTQSSVFGLVSFFPMKNTIAVSTGQSVSGIILNCIRYFILLWLGEGKLNKAAGIFFSISICIMIFVLTRVFFLYKNPYFIAVLRKFGEIEGDGNDNEDLFKEEGTELQAINDDERGGGGLENSNENAEPPENEQGLAYLIKKIYTILIMVILCFAITIGVYPGACLKPDFFKIEGGWKVNSIIFLFNLSDTIGRKLVILFKDPQLWQLYTISLLRLSFLVFIPYLSYVNKTGLLSSNIISVLNIIAVGLMAASSGMANSLCFSLAPNQVKGALKARAGSCVSFCLSVGLFVGSLLANVINIVDNSLIN